jgi:factor associated with neutral sphingomyelinase activation
MLPSFDYLMLLNRLSNRSFQDISQYPLFPWVISDYFSEQFIKNEKAQYRHLWDPVGVHSGVRRQRADELFQAISQDKRKFKSPFHQGVYISTPGYIMFFYMRAVPSLVVRLQSSAFSPPEKIFKSFESLWSSIHSMVNYPSELIPEFYCARQSEILLNRHQITLGSKLENIR